MPRGLVMHSKHPHRIVPINALQHLVRQVGRSAPSSVNQVLTGPNPCSYDTRFSNGRSAPVNIDTVLEIPAFDQGPRLIHAFSTDELGNMRRDGGEEVIDLRGPLFARFIELVGHRANCVPQTLRNCAEIKTVKRPESAGFH